MSIFIILIENKQAVYNFYRFLITYNEVQFILFKRIHFLIFNFFMEKVYQPLSKLILLVIDIYINIMNLHETR